MEAVGAEYKDYKVRPGCVEWGKLYEVKFCALIVLRCCTPDVESAYVAVNSEVCGDFDDFVVCRKLNDQKITVHLIQLKHNNAARSIRENEFTNEKGNFSLHKYLASYKNVTDHLDDINELFGESISKDNIKFILYTNRGVDKSKFVITSNDVDEFLVTNSESKVYTFDNSVGIDQEFLSKFALYANQTHISELDNLIIEEINRLAPNNFVSAYDLSTYLQYIDEWAKSVIRGNYLLTKERIVDKLIKMLLLRFALKFEHNLTIVAPNQNVQTFEKICDNFKIVTTTHSDIIEAFLHQLIKTQITPNKGALPWHTLLPEKSQKKFFETFKQLQYELNEKTSCTLFDVYVALWQQHLLPIVLQVTNEDDFEYIRNVLDSFKSNLKFIITTKKKYKLFEGAFSNFAQLDETLKDQIYDQNVLLQGRGPVALRDLISNLPEEIVSTEIIIKILTNQFNIGKTTETLPEFYVKRTVTKTFLSWNVFRVSEFFCVIPYNRNLFKRFLKRQGVMHHCVFVDDFTKIDVPVKKRSVVKLCEKFEDCEGRNVHNLIFHSDHSLEWVRSYGATKTIKWYQTNLAKPCEINLNNFTHSLNILTANPGMGKSTTLNFIASQAPPNVWISRNDLNKFVEYYSSEEFTSNGPREHLAHFNQGDEFSDHVFRKLLDEKRILVLLDSFDEIAPAFTDGVSKMISDISKAGFQIWLSSRPHLHAQFNSFPVKLNPLTRQDQIDFFTKYFCKKLGMSQTSALDFANKVIVLVTNAKDEDFLGTPMHCQMLAEVVLQTGEINFKENFDLLSLYETFVKQKQAVLTDRFGPYYTLFGQKFYNDYHSFLSLKAIFPASELDEIELISKDAQDSFTESLQNAVANVGILVAQDSLKIRFAHFSFAEFFTGKWLSELFIESPNDSIKKLINLLYSNPIYVNTRNFFDRYLAKGHKLHQAVIDNQISLLEDFKEQINEIDKGGRTPLHLATLLLSNQSTKIMETLLEYSAIPKKDLVLGFDPLDYAVKIGSLNSVEVLCKKYSTKFVHEDNFGLYLDFCISHNYLPLLSMIVTCNPNLKNTINTKKFSFSSSKFFKQKPTLSALEYARRGKKNDVLDFLLSFETGEDKNGLNELHYAAINGDNDRISVLVSRGLNVNETDRFKRTPLHLAISNGYSDVATTLLSLGAKIDIANTKGWTVLHEAAVIDYNRKMIETLIQKGCDLNLKDKMGRSPLYLAIQCSFRNNVQTLLSYDGIDVNTKHFGKTPLKLAVEKNLKEIVNDLKSKGALLE